MSNSRYYINKYKYSIISQVMILKMRYMNRKESEEETEEKEGENKELREKKKQKRSAYFYFRSKPDEHYMKFSF